MEQAINSTGSIDANWVLVGVTLIAVFFIRHWAISIQASIKTLTEIVAKHDTEIEVLKIQRRQEDDEYWSRLILTIQSTIRGASNGQ